MTNYTLLQIPTSEMVEILADPQKRDVHGIPTCFAVFDDTIRVWPSPDGSEASWQAMRSLWPKPDGRPK